MKKTISDIASDWRVQAVPVDEAPVRFDHILVRAKVMKQVLNRLLAAASNDISVLILGETGTGKDLVAQSIHLRSKRRDKPFVALNVGAIPRDLIASELFGYQQGAFTGALRSQAGKIAAAEGGTLFLDEINSMDLQAQASLLRVLESAEYYPVGAQRVQKANVRVIAASNVDPQFLVSQGLLRQDLYYRLDAFTLRLPPLRERPGAVAMLCQEFLREINNSYSLKVQGIDSKAMALLEKYAWPGNVRELKNVLQRAVLILREGVIGVAQLPDRFSAAATGPSQAFEFPLGRKLKELEAAYLQSALKACQGNKSAAASSLGISRKALYEKLARQKKKRHQK